jgi:ATP-dependent RNA helicase SUPV3L1/SUV3
LPLPGPARGIVFQLSAALGCVPTEEVAAALKSLDRASRRALARLGVRFGTETIYVEPLLGPDSIRFRALLWAVWHNRAPPKLPGGRRPGKAVAIDPDIPLSFYAAIGRRVVAGLALRPDRLERLAAAARSRSRTGLFAADEELAASGGVAPNALRGILLALGYRAVIEGDREFFAAKPRQRMIEGQKRGRGAAPRNDNPFAKLKELRFA